MAALRSPRDSLNTPKMLTTPGIGKDEMLSTPTLTTPRTAHDWGGIFSPLRPSSAASSPGGLTTRGGEIREPPADLPLDSSIGLSSPQDGVLAKRRKMKQQNSGARSIESDSNSCDTPDSIPRDLSTNSSHHSTSGHSGHLSGLEKQEDNRPTDLSTTKRSRQNSPDPVTSQTGGSLADQQLRDRLAASSGGIELDHVRDRVHAVNLSSPKHHWQFRLPRDRLNELRPPPIHSKEAASNGADLIHPSPHLPSPNWSTINDIIKSDNLKTPKVLDNFVFDILPPHPTTPKVRDLSPPSSSRVGGMPPGSAVNSGSHFEPAFGLHHPPSSGSHPHLPPPIAPTSMYDRRAYEQAAAIANTVAAMRPRSSEQRVTFGGTTRHGGDTPPPPSHNLTPPPPYPQDLSLRGKHEENSRLRASHAHTPPTHLHNTHLPPDSTLQMRHKSLDGDMYTNRGSHSPTLIIPKQELDDTRPNSASPCMRPQSASPACGEIKEEPRDYTSIPPGFPPYYLPGVNPGHLYRGPMGHPGVAEESLRHPSPPDSPPGVSPALQHLYHQAAQRGAAAPFYSNLNMRQQAALLYEQHHQTGYSWNHPSSQPHPVQPSWTDHSTVSNSSYLKLPLKMESTGRQSTDSPDTIKAKHRLSKDDDAGSGHDQDKDGPPPKKRGKAAVGAAGKGKAAKDPNAPKRVFVCPHCQRSYDWNYNLNRHLKYECGKENSFMCSKCGRRFPHKQNCVYHLKRKHKIMCETVDQYVTSGLVVFSGNGGGGKGAASGSEGSSQNSPPLPNSQVYSPPQGEHSELSNGGH